MATQQDIFAVGSECRPPMLSKDDYVQWSSRIIRYCRRKHNGKFLANSILEGPYQYTKVLEPDDENATPPVPKRYRLQKLRNRRTQNAGNQEVGNNAGQTGNQIVRNPQGNIAAPVIENHGNGQNANQSRCYNCRDYARNCTNRSRDRDSTYYTEWLMLVQQEEAGIPLTAEHHDFLSYASDEEREKGELTGNYFFMSKLQPSSSNIDIALVYDTNEISESRSVEQQNNRNIHFETLDMNFSGGNVEQHDVNYEETNAYFESILHKFKVELDKCVLVNCNDKAKIERLTIELALSKGQQRILLINEKKYNELEIGYHNAFYEKNHLAKRLDDLTRSFKKMINSLNAKILELENQISKHEIAYSKLEKVHDELKQKFSKREDKLLEQIIELEHKIKDKMALGYKNLSFLKQAQRTQSVLYDGKVRSKDHDPFSVYDFEETLRFADESRSKMKQIGNLRSFFASQHYCLTQALNGPSEPVQDDSLVDEEEELALCNAWINTSGDRFKGNAQKSYGFWMKGINKWYQSLCSETLIKKLQTRRTLYSIKEMDLETTQNNSVAKLPILKQEYGNSFKLVARTTTNADGSFTSTIPGLVTTEEKAQKKNDVKVRSMLLMALPNEHQLTFSQYKDAKTLFKAIQARFGGNEATKKTLRKLLKQMYQNFSASSQESLDSISNRLQRIVSQLAILGENISQEDLNFKFLRSLLSEWSMHVVVWRNKLDMGTISFDDLYNNFKIVEQEVKRSVTSSSNSSSQNVAFVSTPGSSNKDNTINVQVSTASTNVVHEDLEQIHENDLEEMDLKWQLALLSLKARKFYQRTGKKIIINESDTAGYDKSNVECFNLNVEDTTSKAMVDFDGAGFDWSFMANEEVPSNLALMAFLDSEVYNHKTCSDTCLKSYETLKSQYDSLRVELNKFDFDLATYKRGLASVEEQLIFYKKNEVMLCDQIAVLKRDASFRDSKINALNIQIEKLKKEKESNQIKIDKFENASKSLDKLIGSQISNNNRKGVGYNVVPPPPTGLFAPPTIDLSSSGLKEFQQPEFEGYGVNVNKSVSENSSNEIKKTNGAPIIEDWVSDCDEDESEVMESDNVQHKSELKPKQAKQPRKISN
ncbi:hypothetical protein Tco_0006189 [Tanacetum coccineum]